MPSGVPFVHRFPLRLPSLSFACFPSVPLSPWLSRIASRSVPLLPAHRPAARVEERGDTIVLLVVMLVVSACLAWCRSCLKTLLGNLLKICLGKLLKTFTGNLLKNDWTYPSFYMSAVRLSAVASLRVAVRCPVVLSIACVVSWLKRCVFRIVSRLVSRLAPRPVMPSCPSPARVFSSVGAYRSSLFASARPRFSPTVPSFSDAPPTRPAWRGEERDGDGLLGVFIDFVRCYNLVIILFMCYNISFIYISAVLND